MFCSQCGKEVLAGAAFCGNCGKAMGDGAETIITNPVSIQRPTTKGLDTLNRRIDGYASPKPSAMPTKAIAAAAAVIIGGTLCAYFIIHGANEHSSVQAKTQSSQHDGTAPVSSDKNPTTSTNNFRPPVPSLSIDEKARQVAMDLFAKFWLYKDGYWYSKRTPLENQGVIRCMKGVSVALRWRMDRNDMFEEWKTTPFSPSAQDKLNNIAWRGVVTFKYLASSDFTPKEGWTEWSGGGEVGIASLMGTCGISLECKNGQWYWGEDGLGEQYKKLCEDEIPLFETPDNLEKLLESKNLDIRIRIAKRLWKERRHERSGAILLAIAEKQVIEAGQCGNDDLSGEAQISMSAGLALLNELGYDTAKACYGKVLSSPYRWQLTTACINKIAEAHDKDMKDAVVGFLRRGLLQEPQRIIGRSPTQEALEFLASIGDATFVPELKKALAVHMAARRKQDGFFTTDDGNGEKCQKLCLLLARMDGDNWNQFTYAYPGDLERAMNEARPEEPRDENPLAAPRIPQLSLSTGRPIIDQSAENKDSIDKFFAVCLKTTDDKRTVELALAGGYNGCEIIDAKHIRWRCGVMETHWSSVSSNALYQADVIFRGTGLKECPWLITKVENMRKTADRIGGDEDQFFKSGVEKQRARNLDGAIADFNKGLLWEPASYRSLCARGWTWLAKGEVEKALADSQAAEQNYPQSFFGGDKKASSLLLRGYCLCQKGECDAAISQFDFLIEENLEKARAYAGRGAAKAKKGDKEGALADYQSAMDLNPNLKDEVLPQMNDLKRH